MAILKIARMGHPVLRRRAAHVADPTTPEMARLAADMLETMADAQGVGLAAPQVHVPLRLVVFWVPAARTEDGAELAPTVLINPVIEPVGTEMAEAFESCLSIPGMTGPVPRHHTIRYHGVGLDGAVIDRTASGFHARVVQHECDHLDGVLYPARIKDMNRFGFTDELRKTEA